MAPAAALQRPRRAIADVLAQVGNLGEDRLTQIGLGAAVDRQTETLVATLTRLQSEVAALRREVQQGSANPLIGHAA